MEDGVSPKICGRLWRNAPAPEIDIFAQSRRRSRVPHRRASIPNAPGLTVAAADTHSDSCPGIRRNISATRSGTPMAAQSSPMLGCRPVCAANVSSNRIMMSRCRRAGCPSISSAVRQLISPCSNSCSSERTTADSLSTHFAFRQAATFESSRSRRVAPRRGGRSTRRKDGAIIFEPVKANAQLDSCSGGNEISPQLPSPGVR